MSEPETTNFVCVQCWKAFTYPRAELTPGQESVLCPHCGEDVPIPPDEEEFSSDGTRAIPNTRDTTALPRMDDDEGDLSIGPPPDDGGPIDPETVVWKLQIPGGLTYNFHGLGALQRWSTGKRNLSEVSISLDGVRWQNFARFSELMDQGLSVEESLDDGAPPKSDGPAAQASQAAQPAQRRRASTTVDVPAPAETTSPDNPVPGDHDDEEFAPTRRLLASELPGLSEIPLPTDMLHPAPTDSTDDLSPLLPPLAQSADVIPVPGADEGDGSGGRTPPVTGQFHFSVARASGSNWRDRVLFTILGLVAGLGIGAVFHVLGVWKMLLH